MKQALGGGGDDPRDDEPIVIEDPRTGFHPDQLTSYPLQRVGTRLYVAYVEAVGGTDLPYDTLLIDADAMEAYTFGGLSADAFDEAPITYSALDPPERNGIAEKPYRGSGELVIDDIDNYDIEWRESSNGQDIVSILLTNPDDDDGLRDVRRQLDRGRLSVEVMPGQESQPA